MMQGLLKICLLGFIGVVISDEQGYFHCTHWPRLLILGTQKAATSSLFEALMKIHKTSNICEAHYDDDEPQHYEKEVHFFDRTDRFEKGPSFYCSRFSTCYRARLRNTTQIDLHTHVDATPNYLDFGIASRMKETFPPSAIKEMKVIVVLREPIGRLLSWYNHMRALYLEVGEEECRKIHFCIQYLRSSSEANSPNEGNLRSKQTRSLFDNFVSFEELFEKDEGAVNLGKYVDILQEFFDVFGMENFLILNYDYFLSKNRFALTKVADFLNIPDAWRMNHRMTNENEKAYNDKLNLKDIDCHVVEKMDKYYNSYNTRLYEMLNKNRKLFPSQMPNFSQFKKFPKCSDQEFRKKVMS